jgi:hypothetical protein
MAHRTSWLMQVASVDLALAVVVGVISWSGGWWTLDEYSIGLQLGGVLVAAVGVFGLAGTVTMRGVHDDEYLQDIGPLSLLARAKQLLREAPERYAFALWMGASGAAALAIGELIRLLAR